ncbi:MAG: OmpA family protein [bacterium]|nr:OmpA family protein [bacterium]
MKKIIVSIFFLFILISSAFSIPTTEESVQAKKLYEKANQLYILAESQFIEAEGFLNEYNKTDDIEFLRRATTLYNQAAKNFESAELFFIEADKILGVYTEQMSIAKMLLDMKKEYIQDKNRVILANLPEFKNELQDYLDNPDLTNEDIKEKINEILFNGNQVFDQGEILYQLGEEIMSNSPTATITDFRMARDYYLSSIDFFLGAYDYYELAGLLLELLNKLPQDLPLQEEKHLVLTVYFDVDKYSVKSEYLTKIMRLALYLKKQDSPRYSVRIEGHTDSDYTVEYNQELSEHRAMSVLEGLNKYGVPLELIETEGYGELEPIADNTSNTGKSRNRRVEIYLIISSDDLYFAEEIIEKLR